MRHRFILIVLLFLAIAPAPACAHPEGESIDAIVTSADGAFEQAAALRDENPSESSKLLVEAIDGWQGAMASGGFENGRLHYNIANAHLLRDEVGLAILHYRRAEELMPGDRNIVSNLAQARLRVPGRVEKSTASSVADTVFFFHKGLAERTRFFVTACAFALTWLLAGAFTLKMLPKGSLWLIGVSCMFWIATGTSLAVDALDQTSEGVVVGSPVIGRKGPDANAYEPSFTEPIAPGIEYSLVEHRGDWLLIRLADGRETWISLHAGRSISSARS